MFVRTRFAPSPTGYLHVGGLRTALYAYLFAKQHQGTFILRIEDTDQSRKVEGATEKLIDALEWAGVEFDEGPGKEGVYGPYIQSQRLPIYHEHVKQLVDQGKAYHCFCTPERLERLKAEGGTMYDRHCRNISMDEARRRVSAGEPNVIRMKIPDDGELQFHDEVRGDVSIAFSTIDDQVLLKSDGFPTYHLAVVVDDHTMAVSHVIRGEEWLPSTPKHILLYQYFGWEKPKFAHLPLLLNPDKSKLSKRQGDVAVEDYRAKGYLKDALVNFVAFLGWNPGDEREIFSMEELVKEFSIERVGKAGAVFNIEKLNWMNQQHIKLQSESKLLPLIKPLLKLKGWDSFSDEYLQQVIGLMKERVVVTDDFVTSCPYFYEDPLSYDETSRAKNWKPETTGYIAKLIERLQTLVLFDAASVETALRTTADEFQVGAGKLIHPMRLAVSGAANGPSLFHMAEVLGRERVVRRIQKALEMLR
ncbi:MAG: glutamate--tRNA ligase [Bacteriovoracaceae bacterium]|nr:glutamate--tRNA ligase [Bacteroidota bacterium]